MSEKKTNKKINQHRFYRVIWRWHFYAGLLVVPIVIIASVTGGIYVFKSEIEATFYQEELYVTPTAEKISFEKQKENAAKLFPKDTKLDAVTVFNSETRANEFTFKTPDDQYHFVFVNQHNGEILSKSGRYSRFLDIVLAIHRNLFAGTFGRILVELATAWSIVLILTGLFLWIPRKKSKVWGVLLPRWNVKKYVIWRDWHNITGFYLSIFTLLVLITGLVFTFISGTGLLLGAFASGEIPEEFLNPPKSTVVEKAPLTLDEAVASLAKENITKNFRIAIPHEEDGALTVINQTELSNPANLRQVFIDRYSGEKVGELNWSKLSPTAKVLISAYPIHVGSIFGMPTKIIAFLVCLALIFASISGTIMWWIRRPKGKLGDLKRHPDYKVPKWLVLVICVLGILLPTVGISIVLILLGDWIWQKLRNRKQLATK